MACFATASEKYGFRMIFFLAAHHQIIGSQYFPCVDMLVVPTLSIPILIDSTNK